MTVSGLAMIMADRQSIITAKITKAWQTSS
jgi:hypothetical protein